MTTTKPFDIIKNDKKFTYKLPFSETFYFGGKTKESCQQAIGEYILENPERYCPAYKIHYQGMLPVPNDLVIPVEDQIIIEYRNSSGVVTVLEAAYSDFEAVVSWFTREVLMPVVLCLDRAKGQFYLEDIQPDLSIALDAQGREVPPDEAKISQYRIDQHKNAIMLWRE